MAWESIGSVNTGDMPGDEEWIEFCQDFAMKYIRFACGEPPPGVELGIMSNDHELGSYPSIGLWSDWDVPQDYAVACENTLDILNSAIEWETLKEHCEGEFEEDEFEDGEESADEEDTSAQEPRGELVFQFNLAEETEKFFDDSSIPTDDIPKLVVLAGGVCAGKTYLRRQKYTPGYVVIDAAEIFLSLSRGEYYEFGEVFEEPLEIIGSFITRRALKDRRNIVTEIIGASAKDNQALIDAAISIGYKPELIGIFCEIEQAVERNLNRGENNISAHYTEPYHIRWILEAARKSSSQADRFRRGGDNGKMARKTFHSQ